jgi:cytoskeletal protein RodZ
MKLTSVAKKMTEDSQVELAIADSPGALLKAARLDQGMSEREAADRLNWMPDYVAVIEADNYQKLRSPAFARGYVKAYARLMALDEQLLLEIFDRIREQNASTLAATRKETKPLHLQKTGLSVAIGLGILILLIAYMWWRSI